MLGSLSFLCVVLCSDLQQKIELSHVIRQSFDISRGPGFSSVELMVKLHPDLLNCTFLLDETVQLLLHIVIPVGDVHVEGVVAADLLVRPLSPLVVGLQEAGTRLRNHMVHWRTYMEMTVRKVI